MSTIVPTMIGFLSGMLCVNFSENQLPEFVYSLAAIIGNALLVDEAPAIMMSRSVQRGAGGGGGGNRPRRAAAPQTPRAPPPPPPEEAITMLTSMGFEREAVIRALQQTDNNVEAAANRLMG